MTSLVFVHGWGFDKNLWRHILALLPKDIPHTLIDFGFTGNPTHIALPENALYIGHSLGSIWLLENMRNSAGFVAIGGFDCFTNHIPAATLKAMQRNLQSDMTAQMKGFYDACGTTYKGHDFNKENLNAGLEILLNIDASEKLQTLSCPIKALAARDDKIVPIGMSQKIWNKEQLEIIDAGGHALPLTQPEFCAKHIQDMIERAK